MTQTKTGAEEDSLRRPPTVGTLIGILYVIYGTTAVALVILPQLTSVKEHPSCQAKNQEASL